MKFIEKYGFVVALAFSLILFFIPLMKGKSAYSEAYDKKFKEAKEVYMDQYYEKDAEKLADKDADAYAFDIAEDVYGSAAITSGLVIFIIALVAAIGLPLFNAIDDPKSLLYLGAGVVVLLALFGISYSMGSASLVQDADFVAKVPSLTESSELFADGMIRLATILCGLAVLGIVVSEIRSFIDNVR